MMVRLRETSIFSFSRLVNVIQHVHILNITVFVRRKAVPYRKSKSHCDISFLLKHGILLPITFVRFRYEQAPIRTATHEKKLEEDKIMFPKKKVYFYEFSFFFPYAYVLQFKWRYCSLVLSQIQITFLWFVLSSIKYKCFIYLINCTEIIQRAQLQITSNNRESDRENTKRRIFCVIFPCFLNIPHSEVRINFPLVRSAWDTK